MDHDRKERANIRAFNASVADDLPPMSILEHLERAELSPAQYRICCLFAHARYDKTQTIKGIAAKCYLHDDTVRSVIRYLDNRHMIEVVGLPGMARQYNLTPAEAWMKAETITQGAVSAKQISTKVALSPNTQAIPPTVNATLGVKSQGSTPSLKAQHPPSPKPEDSLQTKASINNNSIKKEESKYIHLSLSSSGSKLGTPALSEGGETRECQALAKEQGDTAGFTAAIAIGAIMRRYESPKDWPKHEKAELAVLYSQSGIPNSSEIALVSARYAAEWPPGDGKSLRHYLITLLRNWNSEVVRAKQLTPSLVAEPASVRKGQLPTDSAGLGNKAANPQGYTIPGFSGAIKPAEYFARTHST